MLYATGCTNITPYNKDVSYNEFWTNAPDPEKDCETIAKLYAEGLLNGKTCILSIIAEKFTYKEIIEQLEISPNSVSIVRKHSRINGPGCPALEKPIIVRSKICKNALWEKFSATYPNGMKCTSFMFRLQNSRYKYREDLGGLCITCNDYGYQPFRELFVNEDGMADHVDCINHCLLFAFRECMHQHFSRCQECDKIFSLFKDLTDRLDAIHHPKLLEYQEQLICYLAHQTRKAYLNVQFNSILRELDSYGAIIVVNYKCESYLQQLKKQKVNFLPLWVKIISDNGEHYHNSELMTIISHCKVYDSDYVFQERELHAWRIMLYATGCTNITPYNKDVSYNEFWTNAPDPEKDCETIAKLYAEGLLNGKTCILSIIAEKFTYKEIIEQLEISPNSVSIVRKHSRINGPGCPALEKPIIVRSKICKNALWEKFSATYPNGMKCTSFMFRLQNSRYKYREDLGGLCITCNDYGYQPFRELFVNEDGMADHVDCINHCLLFAFRECMHQHFSRCQECDKIFSLFKDLTDRLDAIHHPKLLEYQEQLIYYLAHQTYKAYLNVQFNSILRELDSYGAIIVVNYKCESYLQQLKKQKVNFLIAHAIKRYIRIGCDLTEEENIETAF
ncbi:hypothetical protein RclHR1_08680003 [Rhizophagus clarus]|uniref:Uncharacterized protein n=1 Tax=Rhizophagus clarus TaxID=94130 RepID=A0A2Z6S1U5_9GLOM|nr:hypothetical protein RclHR1_08680003 [Rhizophagus clarus]